MIPFEYRDRNLFNAFDNFERSFFGNSSVDLPAFRTDIRDAGDKYLLDAELPGFNKEDISLDIKDGILTITAEHNESNDQKDDKGNYMLDENGEKIPVVRYTMWNEQTGENEEIYALEPEQVQQIRDLITSTTKVADYNNSITEIVSEQAQAFFEGQKTAEDVARLIQSKANIYVNEQR